MGQTDYIIRFKGDYSALEKDLNKIGQATRKLEEDEVLIKLNYDGNIKEFNKVFDKISNMHPELGIQFQYNVNQKMLEQELDKIDQLTEIKLDVDENKVQTKLKNLADNVDTALQGSMSKDEITKRLKNVFAYYNTAVKAGAKNINFDSITNRLYDSFSIEADEIKNIFDDVFDLNDNKKFELFKLDKSVFDELSEAKSRAEDIRNILKSLEEKGASKTGLPSELQKVQDEIKILRSDIEEMKGDLKNLSGDAFDELTQQIKDTNEQLDYALQTVNQLKSALSSNGIKEDKSISGVIKQWKNENETKTNERYTAFNSQTKQTSGAHLAANAEGVGMKLIRTAIDEMGNDADGVIHSHPMKYAAFSDDDIERYFSLFEDSQGKIFSQVVTSTEQAMSLDMSKINTSKKSEILQQIKDEYSKIDDSLIGNFSGKTEELKSVVYNILDSSKSEYPELISKIRSNIDSMFESIGESFSWMDFSDGFDDLLISSAKDVAKTYSNPKEMISKLLPDLGSIMENVENAVLNPLTDLAQQSYQEVLQRVFTNPEFLKSGETSAIKLEALSDFIDWGSIENSAREAAQKAADALQEAQDSNSPAELTKPLGKDFGLGYSEGIREAMPEVVAACREIVLAAYNTIKEAKTSEDSESVDFSEGFINSFKESLNKAVPTIQEKIKEVFSKINIGDENSSMLDEETYGRLQNEINESGEYLAKVYGDLVEDFKSRLQNAIDETGIYDINIEGLLCDNFYDDLQNDIDGQGKYVIEVKGRLIDTFKEVLQKAIDGLGAFPIEVKPYIRKGSEIEEVELNNEITKTTEKISEGAIEASSNLHLISDELGNIKVFYRGLRDSMGQGLVSDRFNGATFWTDSFDLAKEYSEYQKVESAYLEMINPLEIEGNGANWDSIEYLGTGMDEASKKILAAKEVLDSAVEHFKSGISEGYHFEDLTSEFGIEELNRYIEEQFGDYDSNSETYKEYVQEPLKAVNDAFAIYKEIAEDSSNMYGKYNTKEFVKMAQENGEYDGVIFKNIVDSWSGQVQDLSNVVVQFNQDKIKFIETLKSSDYLNEQDISHLLSDYGTTLADIKGRKELYDSDDFYMGFVTADEIEKDIENLEKQKNEYESILPILSKYQDKIVEITEQYRSSGTVDGFKDLVNEVYGDYKQTNTETETKDLLSKKEVIEQLRTELNLTKKAAEELFDAQGYEKTNNRYQIEQTAVEELIASIKEKQEIEGTSENPNNSPVLTSIDAETQKFDELKKKIATEIPNAIQKKNDAFRKEEEVVAEVVGNEIDYFDVLKDSIGDVETAVQHQYDTSMNATAKDEESKTSTSISSQKNLKSELSSLDKIENKIKELGLSANATQEALSLLYGGKATFLWIGQNQEEQWDKINDLIQLYKELGIVKREVDDSDAFTTTIETTSLKDIQKQKYQSVGQKSDILKEMAAYYSQLEEESAAMAEAAFSNAEKKVNSLLSKISKLQSSGKYTQAFTSELDAAEQELRSFSDDLKNGDIPFDELESRITSLADNVENTLAKKAFGEVKLAAEKSLTSVGLKIDQIVAKNSAMGDEFESRFQKLRDRLDTAESIDDVQKLVAEVNTLESELIAAGKTGRSFFDQIKQRLRDINSKYIAQYFSFQDIIRYARTAISTIQDLNTQMVELAKVSEQSLSEIQDDFNSYADTAKDLGSTITDTISATADWARLGYNVPDAKELSRVALLYKNVGDGIDINAANESLISTLQGYQMQADEAEHIVDVFNEVSNNFAISSGGIGEALQRSAASLNAANTSLEKSVALVTSANTVLQNPESVGTVFKTLSARIRGASTELSDLGEEEDEFTQSTSKLQNLVKSLTGFDILEEDGETFKDIYEILIGIGKEWDKLTDVEQASLGEALAGKFLPEYIEIYTKEYI